MSTELVLRQILPLICQDPSAMTLGQHCSDLSWASACGHAVRNCPNKLDPVLVSADKFPVTNGYLKSLDNVLKTGPRFFSDDPASTGRWSATRRTSATRPTSGRLTSCRCRPPPPPLCSGRCARRATSRPPPSRCRTSSTPGRSTRSAENEASSTTTTTTTFVKKQGTMWLSCGHQSELEQKNVKPSFKFEICFPVRRPQVRPDTWNNQSLFIPSDTYRTKKCFSFFFTISCWEKNHKIAICC